MAVEVLVTSIPKSGKENRCKELIQMVAEEVKKTEPDTEVYNAYSTAGKQEGETDYVVYMR